MRTSPGCRERARGRWFAPRLVETLSAGTLDVIQGPSPPFAAPGGVGGFVFRFARTRVFRLCRGSSDSRQHVDLVSEKPSARPVGRGTGPLPGSVCPTSHVVAQVHMARSSATLTPSCLRGDGGSTSLHTIRSKAESSADGEEGSQAKGMRWTLGPRDPFVSK